MSPNTLNMLSQLKIHLLQAYLLPSLRKKRKKKYGKDGKEDSEFNNMKPYNFFLMPTKLEAFETGVFTKKKMNIFTSRVDAFMGTLFDFSM